MSNAEANLIRNELTNYFVDLAVIQDKRKDIQKAYKNTMHELDVEEQTLVKTLSRGCNN